MPKDTKVIGNWTQDVWKVYFFSSHTMLSTVLFLVVKLLSTLYTERSRMRWVVEIGRVFTIC